MTPTLLHSYLKEEIPFFARIIALVDAYDAMVSGRAYAEAMDPREALKKLSNEKHLFDPKIFAVFYRLGKQGSFVLSEG